MSEPAAPAPAPKAAAPPKKKRPDTPIYKFYEVKGGKATLLRRECPRCGHGVFLAEHKDRLTCGKCGYTSYKKSGK
ncbi:MAG: 30S ribosomal protein S27ae [Nitrososphaerales archaeon]